MDAICAGLCGMLVGLSDHFFGKLGTNTFFKTIVSAFVMTVVAHITRLLGIADNTDAVIIGTLMILVPGLLFTNAMRDIIFGDTNSGINRIVQVLLIAAAIALGTGAAWNLTNFLRLVYAMSRRMCRMSRFFTDIQHSRPRYHPMCFGRCNFLGSLLSGRFTWLR